LYSTIKSTFDDIKSELQLSDPYNPNAVLGSSSTADYTCRRILVESVDFGTHVFVSEGTLFKNIQNIPQGAPLLPIQQVVINEHRKFEGWKTENTH
jgi:hypothetical protein